MRKQSMIALAMLLMQQAHGEDLLTIYQQALQADPMLRSAQLKADVGEAQSGQAGGELLPQINANVNLSLNESSREGLGDDAYKGERYNVALTQSVIDLPKYFNWRRHEELAEQYQKEYLDAWQSLMLDVVERYFAVLESKDALALIRQERESMVKQLAQYRKQYRKRLIKITDLYEIEAKLDGLKADESEAETNYVLAKEGLTQLTGREYEALYELRQDIEFSPLPGDLPHWIDVAKSVNPALQAKQQSVTAAKNDLAQQRSKHLPVVDIQLNYYRSNTGYQNTATPEFDTKAAALNINVPLFSGGTTSKRVDEASYNLEMSKQDRIATLRGVIKEIRDAYLNTNASVKRIRASEVALRSALKSSEAMERGYKYGLQTNGDVLHAQDRVFEARKDLLTARYAYIKSKVRFERSVGEINEQSLNIVNRWLQPVSDVKNHLALVSLPASSKDGDKTPADAVIKVSDQSVAKSLQKAALAKPQAFDRGHVAQLDSEASSDHRTVHDRPDRLVSESAPAEAGKTSVQTEVAVRPKPITYAQAQISDDYNGRQQQDGGGNEKMTPVAGVESEIAANKRQALQSQAFVQGLKIKASNEGADGVSSRHPKAEAIQSVTLASADVAAQASEPNKTSAARQAPKVESPSPADSGILKSRGERVQVEKQSVTSHREPERVSTETSDGRVSGKFSQQLINQVSGRMIIIRED